MYRTFTTPIQNRARQYREYLSLSFAWHERAAMAERFLQPSNFQLVAQALHATRLNCLLEAALAAFDLELISPAEEVEAWWWIGVVTTARLDLRLPTTWRVKWAQGWSAIAAGMQLVGMRPYDRLTDSYCPQIRRKNRCRS